MITDTLLLGLKDLFHTLGAKTSDSNYAVGLYDKTSGEPKGLMDMSNLASVLGDKLRLYIANNSAIRATFSQNFENPNLPANSGFYVRFDDNSISGNGYELFFEHGTANLWFRNESGSGWRKLALATT